MSVRAILPIGHPILRAPTRRVGEADLSKPEIQVLIQDMIDTMRSAAGAGIAANQVGENLRVTVIEVSRNRRYPYKPEIPPTVCINPKWTPPRRRKGQPQRGMLVGATARSAGALRKHKSALSGQGGKAA
jgi:peptide deformylase